MQGWVPTSRQKAVSKPSSQNRGRHEINFHNFPQPDPEQLKDMSRLLIERIGQQTVVAVHKQRRGESGSAVNRIQDEYKIRQPGQNHPVRHLSCLRNQTDANQRRRRQNQTDRRDSQRSLPQQPPVTLDEQLVQILISLPAACNSSLIRNKPVCLRL